MGKLDKLLSSNEAKKTDNSKKEIIEEAQDRIIAGIRTSFSIASENDVPKEVIDEMSKQFSRVEKLFGYVVGSNKRGV